MQKILLVEDDATMKSLLKTLLELEKFQVFFPFELTENAVNQAISIIQPDVILVDVLMNDLNGINLVANLPAKRPYHILMTSGLDVEIECREAGADGFLLKPYSPEELIRRIRNFSAEN